MNRRAYLVAGLGFGDEGKGSIVDYIVRTTGAKLVVRYNGGCQASHNVWTSDGKHHPFSQLGSGSFVPGVRTYLSKHMMVEPYSMMNELKGFAGESQRDVSEKLLLASSAPVITPFHWIMNRARELDRGEARHGSCGRGIGELKSDIMTGAEVITCGDLGFQDVVEHKLHTIRKRKTGEIAQLYTREARDWCWSQIGRETISNIITSYSEIPKAGVRVFPDSLLNDWPDESPIIFEGAQGVLLDQEWGFAPHNTWSETTFTNALKMCEESGLDVVRLGLFRSYFTRHGNGPFPSECDGFVFADDNKNCPWQGRFRSGKFDLLMAKYAVEACSGIDGLVMSHLDQVPIPRCVTRYRSGREVVQMCTKELFEQIPEETQEMTPDDIASELGTVVAIESRGKTAADKRWRKSWIGRELWTSRMSGILDSGRASLPV